MNGAETARPIIARCRQLVEARGIAYHPDHQVVTADPEARRLTFADGSDASYDLLAYVPPHRAPGVVKAAGLVSEAGWIPVDRHTLETAHERVYAVGDVTTIPLELGKPLPKAGVFAHAEAEVVAKNIVGLTTGKGASAAFAGDGECFIETGDRKAGVGRGNFYAEPTPRVTIRAPAYRWHAAKILLEKSWLRRWF